MQRYILSSKNKIAFISGALIALAFLSKWTMGNLAIFEGALIIASILGAAPIAIQAYQALSVKVVSIDVLVTIAVLGAFVIGNFEESAIVTFLFLFGAYLEQRTLNKTRSAIKELTEMAPETALKLMEDGEFEEVDVDDVDVGDVLLVKTGAKVPVDGTVLSGEGSVNEASITGESIPAAKEKGSTVYAGTILDNGTIQIVADRVGEDTTFGKIIELVEEAQDSKSAAERFIDRFSKYYTPAVLVLSFIVWLISSNVELAITILVLGCPARWSSVYRYPTLRVSETAPATVCCSRAVKSSVISAAWIPWSLTRQAHLPWETHRLQRPNTTETGLTRRWAILPALNGSQITPWQRQS